MSRLEPMTRALTQGAEGAYVHLRRVAAAGVEDLRAQDRYLWAKLGVVACWLGLAALAIFIATAPPVQEPTNALGAYASLRTTALGSWALLLHNRSDEAWTDVRVHLDGGHVFTREAVEVDEMLVLSPWQFLLDGEPHPAEARPQQVRVETRRGSASPPLLLDSH